MSLSKEARAWLKGIYDKHDGKLPRDEDVARIWNVSLETAIEWKREFREGPKEEKEVKVRKPRAKKEVHTEVTEVTKVSVGSKLHGWANKLVDSGSLWFAVAIDLVLNGIGFYIIGPDPIMKVGMVCVSVIIVLFSVRAWIKRDKVLWAMFALVASFMDTSFVLLATDVQSANIGKDGYTVGLEDQIQKADEYLTQLQNLQVEKGQGYAQQVKDQTEVLKTLRQELQDYNAKPKDDESQMSASRVATAIPDAILSGKWDRWIFLSLFLTVFVGLQMTIISATGVRWSDPSGSEAKSDKDAA